MPALIERNLTGTRRQIFCDQGCWPHYEPFNCTCPDTGTLHHNGNGEPCPELERITIPAQLIGTIICTNCSSVIE